MPQPGYFVRGQSPDCFFDPVQLLSSLGVFGLPLSLVEVLQKFPQAFGGILDGLPAGCPAKQALQAASEEEREQQDRTAEAGQQLRDDFPEDILGTEQPRHHNDRDPEDGRGDEPRNGKQPRQRRGFGISRGHLISSVVYPHSLAAYRIHRPRTSYVASCGRIALPQLARLAFQLAKSSALYLR